MENIVIATPEIFLALSGMLLLMLGVFKGDSYTKNLCWGTIAVFAFGVVLVFANRGLSGDTFFNMFHLDAFGTYLKVIILLGLIASLAMAIPYLRQEKMEHFEYPVLTLFAGLGMMMMVSSNNLLSLYVALELQALSLYVLATIHRFSMRSAEAGLKYFILGALSSGMLLFGASLIYGFTGTIHFSEIATFLSTPENVSEGVIIGLVFLLVGFAFKISAVPFHMWTPDVYEGSPTSVTALFVIVPKVAAMGLLIRVLFEMFGTIPDQWAQVLVILSVLSMAWGAFAALTQENIKRLMAYSSIGNMGYAMIGLIAGTEQGVSSTLIYMTLYMIMTAGVFSIVLCLRRNGIAIERISDMGGLVHTNPVIAYILVILMFSMTGLPPMAGFFGKLAVFNAAVSAEYYTLAVFGVLTSVVAAYYYLRIIKVVLFDQSIDEIDHTDLFVKKVIMIVCALIVVGLIAKPSLLFNTTDQASSILFEKL